MATNTSDPEILGWVREPHGRGSFGILKSCVLTLVLCVYTALHLNIPPANSTRRHLVWRKAKWILVGIFAPEIVVYVAWAQREEVKKSSKDLAIIFAEQAERDPSLRRKQEWTTTHSWFAYMGGFAFDTTYSREDLPSEYIPRSPQITIKRKILPILARAGFLPDITKESILDKSKADALAKPLDIAEPVLLAEDWVPGFASALWVCHRQGLYSETETVYWLEQGSAELLKSSCTTAPHPLGKSDFCHASNEHAAALPYSITVINPRSRRKTTYDLTPQDRPRVLFKENGPRCFVVADVMGNSLLWIDWWLTGYSKAIASPSHFGLHTLVRWQLLKKFLYDYPNVAGMVFEAPPPEHASSPSPPDNLFLTDRALSRQIQSMVVDNEAFSLKRLTPNRLNGSKVANLAISNWMTPHADYKLLQSMAVFWIAALVYGAVHAAAWNDCFTSPTEALLWKISCVYVAGYGCLLMAILTSETRKDGVWIAMMILRRIRNYIGEAFPTRLTRFAAKLGYLVSVFIPLSFYLFCRAFLVVEGFISLRSLPGDTFRTPDWTQYLPHF